MGRLAKETHVYAHDVASSKAKWKVLMGRRARERRGPAWRAFAAGALGIVLTASSTAAYTKPDWDQAANVKEAAERLAVIQKRQGATAAFKFIDACYRTHSLSSEYTRAFEACIAQDYLETRVLALIYSRMSPETLKARGMPTPQMLADTMGRRIVSAFKNYDVPVQDVRAFKKLVDEHGFPVFFKALFPNSKVPEINDGPPEGEKNPAKDAPSDAPDGASPVPKNGKNE